MKALFILTRKQGVTAEQFRDHMENVHVKLAEKCFVHMMTSYSRLYLSVEDGQGLSFSNQVDCISFWTLPDESVLDEILAKMADPVIGGVFREDERNFLNSDATFMIKCDDDAVFSTACDGLGLAPPTLDKN